MKIKIRATKIYPDEQPKEIEAEIISSMPLNEKELRTIIEFEVLMNSITDTRFHIDSE